MFHVALQISKNLRRASRLSTSTLYAFRASRGQDVDKFHGGPAMKFYPQGFPHPEGPLSRGFRAHKNLLNQSVELFFNQIWLYHHHHALDLYPDLKARDALRSANPRLWIATRNEVARARENQLSFGTDSPRSAWNVKPVTGLFATGSHQRVRQCNGTRIP